MPNWCKNRVTVSGPPEAIHEFKDAVRGRELNTPATEQQFCLQAIIPMPVGLVGTRSPGDSPNWFDWQIENWGCKWGASDPKLLEDSDTLLLYTFDIPGGPPYQLYRQLWLRFLNLSLSWFYYEPNMEIEGYLNVWS